MVLKGLKIWIWQEFLPCLVFGSLILPISSFVFIIPIFILSCFAWKSSIFFWVSYYLWVWYDWSTTKTNSRKWKSLQFFRLFRSIGDYFPLRIVKLADLSPDRNYLLVAFPHGCIPFGCISNWIFNAAGRAELFPDIDVRMVTLNIHFLLPFAREFFLSIGSSTTDFDNIIYLLNSKPSKAALIFPGGVRESFISRPGSEYTVIKENRKGFIRIALETGAPLVPIFSFGEINIYDERPAESGLQKYISEQVHSKLKTRLPVLRGRGIFTRSGIFPYRRPINTIVGRPVEVPKVENPSTELIDHYHEKFYQALKDLFEEHKAMYDEADIGMQKSYVDEELKPRKSRNDE